MPGRCNHSDRLLVVPEITRMDGHTKAPNVPTVTATATAAVSKQIMRKMLLVLAFHALKTIYLTGYSCAPQVSRLFCALIKNKYLYVFQRPREMRWSKSSLTRVRYALPKTKVPYSRASRLDVHILISGKKKKIVTMHISYKW